MYSSTNTRKRGQYFDRWYMTSRTQGHYMDDEIVYYVYSPLLSEHFLSYYRGVREFMVFTR